MLLLTTRDIEPALFFSLFVLFISLERTKSTQPLILIDITNYQLQSQINMTSTTNTNDVPQSVAPSIAFEIPIKKVRSLFVLSLSRHLLLLLKLNPTLYTISLLYSNHRNSLIHHLFKRDWQHKHIVHAKKLVQMILIKS